MLLLNIYFAAFIGLSSIVGAFSVGMAAASTRVIKQIDLINK